MDNTDGWSIDADLAFAPLAARGWQCDWLPWRSPDAAWGEWDAVYIAATWDYPDATEAFLDTLDAVDRSGAVLVNPLELVRWNIPKTYLRDLESRGADIVPSRFYERFEGCELDGDAERFGSDRLIVKPVISTNAHATFLLDREIDAGTRDEIHAAFADRPFIVQPFIARIQSEGEYSLFYIGGAFSHAVRKVPKPADFRVQEEYGADIRKVEPEPGLLAIADNVMSMVDPEPLYARCDFVRDEAGTYRVMELELVEPSLYLRMDGSAPERFAAAFDHYIEARKGNRE